MASDLQIDVRNANATLRVRYHTSKAQTRLLISATLPLASMNSSRLARFSSQRINCSISASSLTTTCTSTHSGTKAGEGIGPALPKVLRSGDCAVADGFGCCGPQGTVECTCGVQLGRVMADCIGSQWMVFFDSRIERSDRHDGHWMLHTDTEAPTQWYEDSGQLIGNRRNGEW